MKGKQKGRPTKWVNASVSESIFVGKAGFTFEVWEKWKRGRRKLGTLIVSVGGLRWWPQGAHEASSRRRSWNSVAEWFET